ncbi:MAG: hypothetical protein GY862_33320 [Gammaproteobacteria bacterium]|nr:hypothetical protein [Gammaproteobacteria bacterium]
MPKVQYYYIQRLAHTLNSAELKQWAEQTAQTLHIKLPDLIEEEPASATEEFSPHLLLGLDKKDGYYTLYAWIEDEPEEFRCIITPEKIDPEEPENFKKRMANIFTLPDVSIPCTQGRLQTLEFFLPVGFLNRNLDTWTPEKEKLLGASYRLIFRCAERLFKGMWRHDWGTYWKRDKTYYSAETSQQYCAWFEKPPECYADSLGKEKCVLGLEFVPDENDFEELFQDGAAILLWCRPDSKEQDRLGLKNDSDQRRIAELPDWLLKERQQRWKKTRRSSTGPLALLWDDPDRLPKQFDKPLESCG